MMLEAERMGRLGYFETVMEQRLDALGELMSQIEDAR
jgi:hypothetical protein